MGYYDALPSYDDLWSEFKEALDCALSDAPLPTTCTMFDLTVVLALLEVVHAVRMGRPTPEPVARASAAFAKYAADQEAGASSRASGSASIACA